MQRKVLGRGLKALIPDTAIKELANDLRVQEIPIKNIVPNRYQPRKIWDESKLEDLANSIKEKGVVQPIIVQKRNNGYEIIAGERRWRAVKRLKQETILALVKDIPETELLEIALIENIQRENLNPLEEAEAYQQLIDKYRYTQEKLSKTVGKNRSSVANYLRLLKLPETVKKLISEGLISMGHARALLGIESFKKQKELSKLIVKELLSVRDVESIASEIKEGVIKKKKTRNTSSDRFQLNVEEEMQKLLGTKVKIKKGKKVGKIELYFYSDDEFERIYDILTTIERGS